MDLDIILHSGGLVFRTIIWEESVFHVDCFSECYSELNGLVLHLESQPLWPLIGNKESILVVLASVLAGTRTVQHTGKHSGFGGKLPARPHPPVLDTHIACSSKAWLVISGPQPI